MATAPANSAARYTVAQYLDIERASNERYYYLDGEIYGMAGESLAHGDISAGVVVSLGSQLKGTPCRVLTKDTKVRSGSFLTAGETTRGLFSYPDVLVVCGEPEYHDNVKDVILNPKVIVEVLSPSTEAFDRGEKFARMQTWNTSLTDYILLSQHRPQAEHFQRNDAGTWSYRLISGLDASFVIASIECTLKLGDIYDRVKFAKK